MSAPAKCNNPKDMNGMVFVLFHIYKICKAIDRRSSSGHAKNKIDNLQKYNDNNNNSIQTLVHTLNEFKREFECFTFCFIVPFTLLSIAVAACPSFFDMIERVFCSFDPCIYSLSEFSFLFCCCCSVILLVASLATTVGLRYCYFFVSTVFIQAHIIISHTHWIFSAAAADSHFYFNSYTFHCVQNTKTLDKVEGQVLVGMKT